MLARGILCRLAAPFSQTTASDAPRFAHLARCATRSYGVASAYRRVVASRASRLADFASRRLLATKVATKPGKKTTTRATSSRPSRPKPTTTKSSRPKKRAVKTKTKKTTRARTRKPKETPRTDQDKLRARIKHLKSLALDAPTSASISAWVVYIKQNFPQVAKKGETAVKAVPELASGFKSLAPAEREHYNQLTNQMNSKRAEDYNAWVLNHSPAEIYRANKARASLRRIFKAQAKGNSKHRRARPVPIVDGRLPSRPSTPYILFSCARQSSDDFKGISVLESSRLIGTEWKKLSDVDRKRYLDQAASEMNAYRRELKKLAGE